MTHPAPVVQLLLTVQFQPAVHSLTIIDWVDLRAEFLDEFPIFAQVARAGAMHPDPTVDVIDVPFGLPRLQLVTEDLTGMMFLQDDRLSVGWQRVTSLGVDPGYPGFQTMLDRTLSALARVLRFLEHRAIETVHLTAAELTYTDAFLMGKDGVQLRTLGDVFNCVQSMDEFKFSRINLTYQRLLSLDQDALSGNVQTTISGFAATPDGEAVSNLQTVIRFDATGADADGLRDPFGAAHRVAHGIYATLVKPDASAILDAS